LKSKHIQKLKKEKIKKKSTEWVTKKLDDVIETIIDRRGITPKKLNSDWVTTGWPVLSAKNIKKQSIVRKDTIRFVNESTYKKWMKEKIEFNDILITSEAPLGEIFQVKNCKEFCVGQRLFLIRSNPEIIDNKFLFYYLLSRIGQNELASRATGSTAGGIRQEELREILVRFPKDLVECEKIGKNLDDLTKKIENLHEQNKNLTRSITTIFNSWFVNFDIETEFKNSEFGSIPKKWEYKKIIDLINEKILEKNQDGNHGEMHPKSSDFVKSGIPFVMANNIENNTLNLKNCNYITKEQADSLRTGSSIEGDVLLTHKATLGRVDIVPKIPDYIMLSPQVTQYRIIDNTILSNIYLKYFFLSDFFQRQIDSISSQSTREYVGILNQREFYILIPTKIHVKKFTEISLSLYKKIQINLSEINNLIKIRDTLLPKLISGEIRV
jgi:type I restriction enzyme, S subunit